MSKYLGILINSDLCHHESDEENPWHPVGAGKVVHIFTCGIKISLGGRGMVGNDLGDFSSHFSFALHMPTVYH